MEAQNCMHDTQVQNSAGGGVTRFVSVNFHYPSGLVGWAVCAYQWLRGYKHWHFSHVSLSDSGFLFNRMLGQTSLGVRADPVNFVPVLVETSCDLWEIVLNADLYRHTRGESLGDCVKFVDHVLLLGTGNHLPAQLYETLHPAHVNYVIREMLRRDAENTNASGNAGTSDSADTAD